MLFSFREGLDCGKRTSLALVLFGSCGTQRFTVLRSSFSAVLFGFPRPRDFVYPGPVFGDMALKASLDGDGAGWLAATDRIPKGARRACVLLTF